MTKKHLASLIGVFGLEMCFIVPWTMPINDVTVFGSMPLHHSDRMPGKNKIGHF